MTLPRRLLPRQAHFLTRRTRNRCGFLRPVRAINQVLLYALGRAQQLAPGLSLHALVTSTTHPHTAITDVPGPGDSQLPKFTQSFHSLVARGLNAYYGRGENFWRQPGSYGNVEVHDRETLEEQLLYVWTNVVKDGLCARPEEWHGVKFLPEDFGREIVVEKPAHAFFGGRRPQDWEPAYPPARRAFRAAKRRAALEERRRARSGSRSRLLPAAPKERAPRPPRRRETLPERVTVTISPPPGYEHLTLEEVRAHFRKLLDRRVAEIHAARKAAGLTRFMGMKAILAQDPFASVGDTFPTFARDPRIACLHAGLRKGLLRGLQLWRSTYRAALARWRDGDRDVRFPPGSYWLPVFHGAEVETSTGPPVAI